MESSSITDLLSNFATKLKSMEERSSILKERVMLINKSFLAEQERIEQELSGIRSVLSDIKQDSENIKESVNHLIKDSAEFARREEMKVFERTMKMWEPLKFVKEEEVKSMIDKEFRERMKKEEKQ